MHKTKASTPCLGICSTTYGDDVCKGCKRFVHEVISWNKDRFEKLRRDGWIVVFRKRVGKRRALYELSYKTKRLIASVYSKLNGNEIPTSVFSNKKYTDKVYRNLIEQLRHPSPE